MATIICHFPEVVKNEVLQRKFQMTSRYLSAVRYLRSADKRPKTCVAFVVCSCECDWKSSSFLIAVTMLSVSLQSEPRVGRPWHAEANVASNSGTVNLP